MLPTASKYFCCACESIQQYNAKDCNKCKSPVIEVGKNTRFPKHPKKSDYKVALGEVSWRLEHRRDWYGVKAQEWDEVFKRKITNFFAKYGNERDARRLIDVFDYKVSPKPTYEPIDGRRLPQVLEDFSRRFACVPEHPKGVYTASCTIWFPFDTSLSDSILLKDINADFFHVRKTHMVKKLGSMKGNIIEHSWNGLLTDNHRYFKDRVHCQIFVTEIKNYVLDNPSEFPAYLVDKALKSKSNQTLEKWYPEMMI